MSDAQTTLGTILTEPASRDAIHIAICPVYSDMHVGPGQRLNLVEGHTDKVEPTMFGKAAPIGIVDPFLKTTVTPRQRFWMFLLPNTVTGMRHHWSHPAFLDSEPPSISDFVPDASAVDYLKDMASTEFRMSYGELLVAATGYAVGGDHYCLPFDPPDVDMEEFWTQFSRATNIPVKNRDRFYRCAC